MDFNNRVVVVTGGGSGIGAACVAFIAARGGKVVVADKNMAAAEAVAATCGAQAIELNIGDETSVRAAGITGINVPVDAGCLVATPWASYGGLR